MKVLAIASGLGYGGAQVSTLEFFELLRDQVSLKVIVCEGADAEFVNHLRLLGIEFRTRPCYWRGGLPYMDVSGLEDWIKWADVVWITDIEFPVAPKIKRVRSVPVIAHLHSYPLLCPWWGLLYGMREVCYRGCSLHRIVRCKQLFNEELSRLGIISGLRKSVYQALDLVKGPLDYFRWRRVVNRDLIDSIDGFIAVSNFVKRVQTLLSVKGKPIEVVYNPVTYPLKYVRDVKPRENLEENLIIYASGSNPVKGPHLALQALKLLLNEGLNVKLVMFGCRGSWIEEYARKLGVGRSAIFLGKESFARLYETISSASVVVMPSVWPEPFGRVPVEANRLGVVAVVTNRGGLPETVVHGETGYIANPHHEDIAKWLLKALESSRGEVVKEKSLKTINPQTSVDKLFSFLTKF
ncbi:MAG: glycosyltransferase family 4 protein [Candidatus Nezhaarchaeales archaeon]